MVCEEARTLEALDIRFVGRRFHVEVATGLAHAREGDGFRRTHFHPVQEAVGRVDRSLLAEVEGSHRWRRSWQALVLTC